jgi:hypothetical protein
MCQWYPGANLCAETGYSEKVLRDLSSGLKTRFAERRIRSDYPVVTLSNDMT